MTVAGTKKVLIIEDEKDLVKSLTVFFESHGLETIAAYDAACGVRNAHKGKVDLIILDLMIPAGGGIFVLERLKQSVITSPIPVVIITAKPGKELEDKAYKLGVKAYFHKPFDPEQLLKKIKDILGMDKS